MAPLITARAQQAYTEIDGILRVAKELSIRGMGLDAHDVSTAIHQYSLTGEVDGAYRVPLGKNGDDSLISVREVFRDSLDGVPDDLAEEMWARAVFEGIDGPSIAEKKADARAQALAAAIAAGLVDVEYDDSDDRYEGRQDAPPGMIPLGGGAKGTWSTSTGWMRIHPRDNRSAAILALPGAAQRPAMMGLFFSAISKIADDLEAHDRIVKRCEIRLWWTRPGLKPQV